MGKNVYTRHLNDEIDEVDRLGPVFPRCIWGFGFVHNIDYHHWRSNLKRILLQKINPRKRLKGKAKAKELDHDVGELQKLLNEDEKSLPAAKESGVKQKRSLKARIKALIAEEISKEGNGKQMSSSVSSQPQLKRLYSMHHLEPPDHGLPEVCTDWESPIFFFSDEKDSGATKLWDLKKMNVKDKGDVRGKKSEVKNKESSKDRKEHANVLEIFKVNKHLFLENLQDRNDGLRKFPHNLPTSRTKARLSKSGSYPAARLVQKRELDPSTLKQKQSETWPALKGEKPKNGAAIHSRSKSLPSEYSIRGSKFGQALNFFLETSTESDERNSESTQCVQPDETKVGDEVSNGYNSSAVETYSDKRTVESALSRSTRTHRRSSSLNESLDKYTRLFGNDLGKEVNLGSSRSLRLRNEYEVGLGGNGAILFGRIRSLSHLESYSSIQNGVTDNANLEDQAITAVEEGNSSTADGCQDELKNADHSPSTEEAVPNGDVQDSIREYAILDNVEKFDQIKNLAASAEISTNECVSGLEDLREEADSLMVGKTRSFREPANEFAQPEEVETFLEEVSSSSEEFHDSEDLDSRDQVEPSSLSSIIPNVENLDDTTKDEAELSGIYKKQYTDLDYVKAILEYSGFDKDALQKTWFSSSQPIGPSVFVEMEANLHKELECSEEDCVDCYRHQLLFDIVNEKLLNIYNRSYTYYPQALSSSCHIPPFPKGDHIVDEICKSISTLLSLKPEQKQSLEYIVGLDMKKDDGWMNLQWESECLALELEDTIFDELMEDLEDMIFEQVFGS